MANLGHDLSDLRTSLEPISFIFSDANHCPMFYERKPFDRSNYTPVENVSTQHLIYSSVFRLRLSRHPTG